MAQPTDISVRSSFHRNMVTTGPSGDETGVGGRAGHEATLDNAFGLPIRR